VNPALFMAAVRSVTVQSVLLFNTVQNSISQSKA